MRTAPMEDDVSAIHGNLFCIVADAESGIRCCDLVYGAMPAGSPPMPPVDQARDAFVQIADIARKAISSVEPILPRPKG